MPYLAIAVGGAGGALARYIVDDAVSRTLDRVFPWGTLLVNLSGASVLGLLYALAIEREVLSSTIRGPLMIGFLGAYTTFSTLMLESWRLIELGDVRLGLANLLGSVGLGTVAVVAGLVIGRWAASGVPA